MSTPTQQFVIPNIYAEIPWTRKLSEFYDELNAESNAWMESYRPFDEDGLKRFKLCNINSFTCRAYSFEEKDAVGFACDLMNFYWIYDEYTDAADANQSNKIREIVLDAFRTPNKEGPGHELFLGAMASSIWIRQTRYLFPAAARRFVQHFDISSAAIVGECSNHGYKGFQDYLLVRRLTSMTISSFVTLEFGLYLSEEVMGHAQITRHQEQTADLIGITNDIYSYPMERARGPVIHNAVEVVMAEESMDVQASLNWLGFYASGVYSAFLHNIANLPSWGDEVDRKVRIYAARLDQFVRANDDWSSETPRYFGSKGLEVQETRIMTLLPPSNGYVKKADLLLLR